MLFGYHMFRIIFQGFFIVRKGFPALSRFKKLGPLGGIDVSGSDVDLRVPGMRLPGLFQLHEGFFELIFPGQLLGPRRVAGKGLFAHFS